MNSGSTSGVKLTDCLVDDCGGRRAVFNGDGVMVVDWKMTRALVATVGWVVWAVVNGWSSDVREWLVLGYGRRTWWRARQRSNSCSSSGEGAATIESPV